MIVIRDCSCESTDKIVDDLVSEILSLQEQLHYSEKQMSLAQQRIMQLEQLLEGKGE